tara:strand:- start:129 stop:1358 length:1230 start_codon:yes stop_codon:yes gene_type:complete
LKKIAYLIIFFIVLTKTYVLVSKYSGIPVGLVTMAVLGSSLFLLFLELNKNNLMTPKNSTTIVFLFSVLGPLIVLILTDSLDLRFYILQILYFTIFLLAIQFVNLFGYSLVNKISVFALFFTGAYGLLSVVNPIFFKPFADIVDALWFYGGRAFGFYLQPNAYGMALNITFLCVFASSSKDRTTLTVIPFYMIFVIVSGSRTAMAVMGLNLILVAIRLFLTNKKALVNFSLIFLGLVAIIVIAVIPILIDQFALDSDYAMITERLFFMFGADDNLGDMVEADGSMQDRLEYQAKYIDAIKEKPFTGYGFGAQELLINKGKLIDTSHNTYLEILLQGGLPFFFLFILFCFQLFANFFDLFFISKTSSITFAYLGLLLLLLFYFSFSTTVLFERIVYLSIGFLVPNRFMKN